MREIQIKTKRHTDKYRQIEQQEENGFVSDFRYVL